jgi:hypothetical protein
MDHRSGDVWVKRFNTFYSPCHSNDSDQIAKLFKLCDKGIDSSPAWLPQEFKVFYNRISTLKKWYDSFGHPTNWFRIQNALAVP